MAGTCERVLRFIIFLVFNNRLGICFSLLIYYRYNLYFLFGLCKFYFADCEKNPFVIQNFFGKWWLDRCKVPVVDDLLDLYYRY